MTKSGICLILPVFIRCMGISVPEDYMADVYYGQTRVISVSASTSTSLSLVPVQVQFSSPMDLATVTGNTMDTSCTGTIQVSTAAANFAPCLQLDSLSSTYRDSIFTATLLNDIDPNSNYLVRVLGTATDFRGT